ncbi:MerR HTH family regulatory protein [Amycolatopsis pretoriensis]|uniref:MerR HTH family regulatory protein n=1 Tax=Amycolatopsis pretoriensis TaxID=218821 RepID=A0A1H5RFJ1_9PSEU|nr:MerR family transcriptional regulator [Amycolatopsis pretoriensis]SEF37172.1 MerR HTH family regulatory protein [Amycolatopsis pretoriensis]
MSTTAAPAVTWTAGAVARMLGLPPSTLRAWHRRYDLPLSTPQTGSHRRYGRADVDALLRMKHLIDQGCSADSAAKRAFHDGGSTDVATLLAAVRRLKMDTATALLDAHLTAHDVITTWDQLCRPALTALSDTEADRCIDLVHALSWVIAAALHRIPPPADAAPPVLLACADGERHTLPLEALRAALAERGRAALFLGASLPVVALEDAVTRTKTAAVAVWASRPRELVPEINGARVLLLGPGWPPARGSAARPATLPEALDELTAKPSRLGSRARSLSNR